MAFTFNADPTSPSMNSYTSVAVADDYFASRFARDDDVKWGDLQESQKQALLVTASRLFDTFKWGGLKTSKTQPMQWPRQTLYDNEGQAYPSNSIPRLVNEAICEQAFWTLNEDNRTLDDDQRAAFVDFKAGPLSVKINKSAPRGISPKVEGLLLALGDGILLALPGGTGARTLNMQL